MDRESSPRALAVILGASTFPASQVLTEAHSFLASALEFRKYLLDPQGLALDDQRLLNLFDDPRSPSDQLLEIARFLMRRSSENRANRGDLLLYYVGHGLFTRGDQAYCLAVRCTSQINEGATSIRAVDLAQILKEYAAFLRKYLILDCCFSATMYREFMSAPLEAVRVQIQNELPSRGTALLCSSSAREPSLAPSGLEYTMFSSALLRALRQGHPSFGAQFAFSELGAIARENLRAEFPDSWVRPEVHAPDQREGLIADIPMFPNPAFHDRPLDEVIGIDTTKGASDESDTLKIALLLKKTFGAWYRLGERHLGRPVWIAFIAVVLFLAGYVWVAHLSNEGRFPNNIEQRLVAAKSGRQEEMTGYRPTRDAPKPSNAQPEGRSVSRFQSPSTLKPQRAQILGSPDVRALTAEDLARITVKGSAQAIAGVKNGGYQLYQVTLFVDGPPRILDLIKEVEYEFPPGAHPPFHPNPKHGQNRSDDFRINYVGYQCGSGCLVTPIIIPLAAQKSKEVLPDFDLSKLWPE
jgi:hypothetical protein